MLRAEPPATAEPVYLHICSVYPSGVLPTGHTADNCRKRQADYRGVRSDIICFKCGKQGHRQFTCPNSIQKGSQETAALQLTNETLNHDDQSMCRDSRPHNCDESQGDGEVASEVFDILALYKSDYYYYYYKISLWMYVASCDRSI